jgi:tetratricopeptide (TPR) repeat protein
MDWRGGDVIGEVENPLDGYRPVTLPEAVQNSTYYGDLLMLQNPDTFARFQAVGRIVSTAAASAEDGCVAVLAEAIRESAHSQFNRDVLECIHYLVGAKKTSPEDVFGLVGLLAAVDDEVQVLVADDFGVYGIKEAKGALARVLKSDRSDQVRRFALRSLMELRSAEALPHVRDLAMGDPSEDVRRLAVTYLARVRDSVDPFLILAEALTLDPASSVRVAAAQALGDLHEPEGTVALRQAAMSGDVYLARAAGRSLAELYQVDGIGFLIESLSFPSIDAFYNYDRNVPNTISSYADHDMPEEERYDQAKWSKWFEANKDKIDIRSNVEATRGLAWVTESLAGATPEQEIDKYEAFLTAYPGNPRAQKVLSEKLNQVAWDMVTAPVDADRRKIAQGLKYALRAVELNPSPNFYDTLAEAYLADGDLDHAEEICHTMLVDHPDEQMFIERLGRIARARRGEK